MFQTGQVSAAFGTRYFRLAALACLLPCLAAAQPQDRLTTWERRLIEGAAEGYQRGRFAFKPDNADGIEIARARVIELDLSPPARVSVKLRGRKEMNGLSFLSYRDSRFYFIGPDGEIVVPGAAVTSIRMELDFDRYAAPAGRSGEQTSEPFDLRTAVRPGGVTIVHFHMPSVHSSVRQGNYVQRLAERDGDNTLYVRVDLSGWDDPVARRYAIVSVPQFWFHNRRGEEVVRLVERFTEQDIDGALSAARSSIPPKPLTPLVALD